MVRLFRTVLTLAAALAASSAAAARPAMPDVDTIVARHIAARGGEAALRAISSLMWEHGQYSEPGDAGGGGATMMIMRPYYKLVGDPRRKNDIMEGYDGAAWEWYSEPNIVLRTTGAANAAARHNTYVDGQLLDYRSKGNEVALTGEEAIGGRPAYRLRVTMPDGFATDEFVDENSYLLIASRQTAKVHAFGDKIASETRYSDFRRVNGVLFPFRSSEVEIATGKELNRMQWGSITANRDIPVSWFSPPVYQRNAIETFTEQLYMQREDPSSVMWTYRVFRRANPNVDTSDAAQVAGYQALKMDQTASAIALLEQNAKDYPNKANAAFGLGRAYAAAGRTEEARVQFQRALKLDPKHGRAAAALADLDRATAKPQ